MRVAWLSQYPLNLLHGDFALKGDRFYHPSSWIVSLAKVLVDLYPLDLHIITSSPLVNETRTIKKGKITFHVVRYAFPFTNHNFPAKIPLDTLSGHLLFSRRVNKVLAKISPDLIHAHGTEHAYGMAAVMSKYRNIISIQGILSECVKVERANIRFQIGQYWEKYVVRKGRNFIAKTPFARQFIKSINPNANVYDIENPMNPIYFAVNRNNIQPSLLFVGTICDRKGIFDLVEAFSILVNKYKDVALKIAGSGRPKFVRAVKQRVIEKNLQSHVTFMGNVLPEQIAQELSSVASLVLPSKMDNSPNVISEAMAAGVPAVATHVGGIPFMVKDGQTGILVPVNNPQALAKSLIRLLEKPKLVQQMGQRAKDEAVKRFSPPLVAKQVFNAYQHIVNSIV